MNDPLDQVIDAHGSMARVRAQITHIWPTSLVLSRGGYSRACADQCHVTERDGFFTPAAPDRRLGAGSGIG
jgi:hypothetical protein